jgi:TPR repeat protein
MDAHVLLARLYNEGKGVERDPKKQLFHLEEAAIGGHPRARYMLGCVEGTNGNKEKAAKHFIIAANQGHDEGLKFVKKSFLDGAASKEEYESALRGHQAAVDATKSAQREEAYAFFRKMESITGEEW